MLDYQTTMKIGQDRYQDVLDRLRDGGMPGVFTQTGGMCAALEVVLDSGHTLLVTDEDDTLSWDRAEHRGWGVGLYPPDYAHNDGECLTYESTDDGSADALLPLIDQVLAGFLDRRRTQT
jgi:hypothetical protein